MLFCGKWILVWLYLTYGIFAKENQTTNSIQQSLISNSISGNRSIAIVGNDIILNGRTRLHIASGSLHYFRVPSAYWEQRLYNLKLAGLNTVSTYVEWSFHEAEERQYDFTKDRDIAKFITLAGSLGLHVLLRPGPYICAERDLGGFPYWLLSKYPDIKLRTTDKNFMFETEVWLRKLFSHLTPLLYGNGGPIIFVQVENEYGSYGEDKIYLRQLRDLMSSHVKGSALLYTTDGPFGLSDGSVEGALTTVDFGAGSDVSDAIKRLRNLTKSGPLMNSEFYPGWLTHWTEVFARVPTDDIIKTLKDMLQQGMHVNFYMFFGGTNFEFSAGANFMGRYLPDITSYDYDAPMDEAGDPTKKYYAIRTTLETFFPDVKHLPLPERKPKGNYGTVTSKAAVAMLTPDGRKALGTSVRQNAGKVLPTFEMLRQRSGLVLYEIDVRTKAKQSASYQIYIKSPRDRVYVYADKVFNCLIDRQSGQLNGTINSKSANFTLSLLVENQGRINYGALIHDFKGIRSDVMLEGVALDGNWTVTGFSLETLNQSINQVVNENKQNASVSLMNGPVLFEGYFVLPASKEPLKDTYIDTTGWGKGYIWINGHNLGRYWPGAGPQVTLYVPGAWIQKPPAQNIVHVLELEPNPYHDAILNFIDHPIFVNYTALASL